jgi:peptidoglycan/LPS O-acetylase OafA/YrhL
MTTVTATPQDVAVGAPAGPEGRAERPHKEPRLIQFDIIRGLAVFLVLNGHPLNHSASPGKLWRLAQAWHQFGWTAVESFFVLSGFLVGGLLFKELRARGSFDTRRFIIRRGFKIWPSYLVFVAFLFVLLAWQKGGLVASFKELWPNIFHVQNYCAGPRGHTWSLSLEEHFYLALPLLFYLLCRQRKNGTTLLHTFPWIVLAVAVACLAMRWLTPVRIDSVDERVFMQGARWTHYYPTHMRIDSVFFGVLLAYWFYFHPARLGAVARYRRTLLLIGTALLAPMVFWSLWTAGWISVIGYTMAYLGYGCILVAFLYTKPGDGLLGRALASRPARVVAFIGLYSYPIYLWHIDAAQERLNDVLATGWLGGLPAELHWALFMTLYVVLAVTAGVVMGKLVERPSLALRDRLFPSRVAALASPAPPAAAPKVAAS